MKSAELAQRAGVTVRTLRHYHQLGILSEPARGANGYRAYSMQHLARVLRLKNLSSAGVPLESAARMIDGGGATSEARSVLDDIDRELAEKIDMLTAQRATIAAARALNTTPDMPSGLLDFASFLSDAGAAGAAAETGAGAGAGAGAASTGRDQLAILAHLDQSDNADNVSALLDTFAPVRHRLIDLSERFESLTEESEVPALIEEFRLFQVDVAASVSAATTAWLLEPQVVSVLDMYTRENLNAAQAAVFAALADS
jgi:DNA-binding transcriptional MerR regulator